MKKKTLTERYIDASLEDGYYYVKYRNGVIGIDVFILSMEKS